MKIKQKHMFSDESEKADVFTLSLSKMKRKNKHIFLKCEKRKTNALSLEIKRSNTYVFKK